MRFLQILRGTNSYEVYFNNIKELLYLFKLYNIKEKQMNS